MRVRYRAVDEVLVEVAVLVPVGDRVADRNGRPPAEGYVRRMPGRCKRSFIVGMSQRSEELDKPVSLLSQGGILPDQFLHLRQRDPGSHVLASSFARDVTEQDHRVVVAGVSMKIVCLLHAADPSWRGITKPAG